MDTEARQYVGVMLPAILTAVAKDRGCHPDDLSMGASMACEQYGLQCFRYGYDHQDDENGCIKALRPRLMAEIASDRAADVGDFHSRLWTAVRYFGEACFRDGNHYAHEEVTLRIPVKDL